MHPIRPAEEEDDEGGVEEELLLHHQHLEEPKRRRGIPPWVKQTGLFVLGAIFGTSVLSVILRSLAGDPSSSPSSKSPDISPPPASETETFDFTVNPPVRIHYLEDQEKNSHPPLLPPSNCPIPVVYTKDQDSADIVVVNSDSHKGLEPEEFREWRERKPWQKLAIWGVESAPNREVLEKHFDAVREGRRNETYDYDMTCESMSCLVSS